MRLSVTDPVTLGRSPNAHSRSSKVLSLKHQWTNLSYSQPGQTGLVSWTQH